MGFRYIPISPKGAVSRASILEFDGVRILADPGWDGFSDLSYLDPIINTIDIILLSHPTNDFIGAYAYLAFKDLQIPIYATLPTTNLGRVSTIDLYRSVGLIGPLTNTYYELTDVEEVFDKIITVKHSQTIDLRGKYDGLTITALNSGHTLGGTIWVLNKNSEKITYAPEFNQAKDSFLNGADLNNNAYQRSSVVITSSKLGSSLSHKKRVERFFELVDATLGRGGTVLLPTSIGGRMLELIHLIDDHLQSAPIPVLLVSHAKARSLTYAGSMLEWMAPTVIKDWESKGQVPFDASRVQVIEPNELLGLPGSKVVFASGSGFEDGSLAQDAFRTLCQDEKTTVILTERSGENTIGNELYKYWKSKATSTTITNNSNDGIPIGVEKELNVKLINEHYLTDELLKDYEIKVKERRSLREQNKKQKKSDQEIQFENESESESEDEDLLDNSKKTEEIQIDLDVRNLKGRSKMFPFIQTRLKKSDDYGIIINPADFIREEEKDIIKTKKKIQTKVQLGEKKKWNEGKKQDDVSDIDSLFKPRTRSIQTISINAKFVLSYLDLEGLADLRSVIGSISAMKPRNVIITGDFSDHENIDKVINGLKKINKFEVLRANENEEVESNNSIQSFDILLDEELSSQLKWQKIANGYTIAHIIGGVKTKKELKELKEIKSEAKIEEDVKMEDDSNELDVKHGDDLVLVPLEQNSSYLSNIRAAPLAIGDVKLPELRRILQEDHKVEFKGDGTLVIDDIVAVRKVSDGDVIIDGLPSALYYEVRDVVRSMLAYV
ncbi:hypothetical protein WICMUC_003473 [Wickerhamomyces mucosus]|uniref:Cleavage and polyadenylation specificity factor subunit 2 n=1 Tax=Wickerhamomyces mucosus TaxID=1378264 RepID=A0A9P8PLH2_9ASCO|nr:hypothetical protein WICMUC_003473 [Wickerhamomyces mucosus]